MTNTQRLTVIEGAKGFLPFRRRPTPPPDPVMVGQMKLKVADACIEQMRSVFSHIDDQIDVWELVERILKDAERDLRAYRQQQEME